MAHHRSAEKKNRRDQKFNLINRMRVSRIRTAIRAVEDAIDRADKTAAQQAFVAVTPLLHQGVNKHVLHQNTASRKLSRLSKRIKAIGATQ